MSRWFLMGIMITMMRLGTRVLESGVVLLVMRDHTDYSVLEDVA